jgi:hypothetical protein
VPEQKNPSLYPERVLAVKESSVGQRKKGDLLETSPSAIGFESPRTIHGKNSGGFVQKIVFSILVF